MKISIPIFSIFLLFSCNNKAQPPASGKHTDLKEFGFKGKVKKVTTFDYADVAFSGEKWEPVNDSSWLSKTISDFDSSGNLEKVMIIANSGKDPSEKNILVTVHTRKNGVHTAKDYDGNGNKTGTIKYEWIDKTSYKIAAYTEQGRISYTSKVQLADNFRDKAGEFMGFNESDSLVYGFRYENILDSNRFVKVIRTYLKPYKVEETYFSYRNFDKEGNPHEALFFFTKGSKPYRVSRRVLEYYR